MLRINSATSWVQSQVEIEPRTVAKLASIVKAADYQTAAHR
jgi:hypothetical protein